MKHTLWIATLIAGCVGQDVTEPSLVPELSTRPAVATFEPRTPAPAAITGGTLEVSRDDGTAILADGDRGRIFLIALADRTVRATVQLGERAEPFRIAEDAAGRVHVTLRGTGEIATVDLAAGTLLSRTPVCPAPRGITYDPASDDLLVACAGGELVTLGADDLVARRTQHFDDDLRDVVLTGGRIWISRFRSAELLQLSRAGELEARHLPPSFHFSTASGQVDGELVDRGLATTIPVTEFLGRAHLPRVAYRLRATPNGDLAMLHQRQTSETIEIPPPGEPEHQGAYLAPGGVSSGGTCADQPIHGALTLFDTRGAIGVSRAMEGAVLPVDFVVDSAGRATLVFAGGFEPSTITIGMPVAGDHDIRLVGSEFLPCLRTPLDQRSYGHVTAVALTSTGTRILQTRDPVAAILLDVSSRRGSDVPIEIERGFGSRGHDLFHLSAGAPIACASCHPEGGEDGHTWTFSDVGARRTQTTLGGVLGSAPFHWGGEVPSFRDLTREAMRRMAHELAVGDVEALGDWVDTLPAPPPRTSRDPAAAERGRAVFEASGCAECHSGATMSNDLTLDVGTFGAFQVPSLIGVAYRAPYFHDGCAPTLESALAGCDRQPAHGAPLAPAMRADLAAFLETL